VVAQFPVSAATFTGRRRRGPYAGSQRGHRCGEDCRAPFRRNFVLRSNSSAVVELFGLKSFRPANDEGAHVF
jgi:hypothetical protein